MTGVVEAAIKAELPNLRAEAEARMVARCAIMRKTGLTEQNETNGREVPVWATIYADHPVRVAGVPRGAATHRTIKYGGVEQEVAVRTIHLPHDTTGLADGDLVVINTGENTNRVYRLIETEWQDQATARRLPAHSVQRPEEWD